MRGWKVGAGLARGGAATKNKSLWRLEVKGRSGRGEKGRRLRESVNDGGAKWEDRLWKVTVNKLLRSVWVSACVCTFKSVKPFILWSQSQWPVTCWKKIFVSHTSGILSTVAIRATMSAHWLSESDPNWTERSPTLCLGGSGHPPLGHWSAL